MRLVDILSVDRIDTQLTARSKAEALSAMARLLTAGLDDGATPTPEVEVERVLREREALASTGVGSGVAIPHGRLAGATRFVGALAIDRDGVAFDAIDGKPALILFALVGPERAAGEHLKCLARITRVLRDDAVRARLLAAEDATRAMAIVAEADTLG